MSDKELDLNKVGDALEKLGQARPEVAAPIFGAGVGGLPGDCAPGDGRRPDGLPAEVPGVPE